MTREDLYERFMRESNAIEGEVDSCGSHCCDHGNPGKLYLNDLKAITMITELAEEGSHPTETDLLYLHFMLSMHRDLQYKGDWRRCNVQVGGKLCPVWKDVPRLMETYLSQWPNMSIWEAHTKFEGIHPFEDLNGRVGRLLWLWRMIEQTSVEEAFELSFLHHFYYQTLTHYNP
jgi:hypothetical protein|tara:strand:- start:527 stop:1048 length:522 start_codon:yes stop_codon:yes gene_type:complete